MTGRLYLLAAALVAGCLLAGVAMATDKPLADVERQIRELREENERNQQRIRELENTVKELKTQQQTQKEQIEQAKTPEAKPPEAKPESVRTALDKYWGEHRFIVTGYGFAQASWMDREHKNTNTFLAGFNPTFLFRVNKNLLFSGELEVKLPDDGETEANLEFAQADYFVNDHLTVTAGKSLLPFGEFIERIHPPWINRLVTHPLPFREGDEGGILPFSTLGAQLRGGVPLRYADGAAFDYAVYIANGPHYETQEDGVPRVGDPLTFNNIDNNTNKAFGARLGAQLLPRAWDAGRWRFGGSTYDGEWDDQGKLWFTSWGMDTVYQYRDLELRGEYVATTRELAGPLNDHRDGWYGQAAYSLASLAPEPFNKIEVVGRYAHQNQRAVPLDSDQLPHERQASFGLDYWVTPSVVWKLEYDRDLPREALDSNEVWTQFAVGF